MDPAAIASITTEVYKVGGIVAVLLVIMCIAAISVWRFFLRLINDLSERLNTVQNERAEGLSALIIKTSDSMGHFAKENAQQTRAMEAVEKSMLAVVNALGARRCLVDTDRFEQRPYDKRPTLPMLDLPTPHPALQQRPR